MSITVIFEIAAQIINPFRFLVIRIFRGIAEFSLAITVILGVST